MITFITINLLAQKKKKQSSSQPVVIEMKSNTSGVDLQIAFEKGPAHNHPTFAIWIEDENGKLLETLFVTKYFATGIFGYADGNDGAWKNESGESIRPAALPYWSHKRNIISRDSLYVPTSENPVPDAITGATPGGSFDLITNIPGSYQFPIVIKFEINQTWDWNEYWTNGKYPDDKNYKSSAQPSVIYSTKIDSNTSGNKHNLKPIGHGHYSGNDGNLYSDLSTLTTALEIAKSISVTIN